jgi:hypothetical protein
MTCMRVRWLPVSADMNLRAESAIDGMEGECCWCEFNGQSRHAIADERSCPLRFG